MQSQSQQQQQAIAQITRLIQESSSLLECDAACQSAANATKLKTQLDTAKARIHSAPRDYEISRKNYITFTQGELYYSDVREKELTQKAAGIADKLASAFRAQSDIAHSVGVAYDTNVASVQNTAQLATNLRNKVDKLNEDATTTRAAILTNERMSWYESVGIDVIRRRYHILRGLYLLSAIAVLVMYLVKGAQGGSSGSGVGAGVHVLKTAGLGFLLLWWLPFSSFTLLWAIWAWLVRVKSILFPRLIYTDPSSSLAS